MTTILGTDETGNVDLAESGRKRSQDRVACFLHHVGQSFLGANELSDRKRRIDRKRRPKRAKAES
jgi:hypothetical protein